MLQSERAGRKDWWRMILEPLECADGVLPGALLDEITAMYASNRAFHRLSGEFPDPDEVGTGQVAAELAGEPAHPHAEVLLARSSGRLVGMAVTLARHPDPADPDPWIGLLMVHGSLHRSGLGRQLASLVEARLREAGRLAVLENNPGGMRFRAALGYRVIGRREDLALHRPCAVLRKSL